MPTPLFKPVQISVLKPSDNVEEFDCGDPARNSWLKTRAKSSQTNDDSRTYVALQGDDRVCGFYAISTSSIIRSVLPGSMRRNAPDPVSCILLAQLGVTASHQGQGLSRELVLHAMAQVVRVAEIVGCRLLIVHPATPELIEYYKKFEFKELETAPGPIMAISLNRMRAILTAVEEAATPPTSS